MIIIINMNRKYFLVVMAAGHGTRMGAGLPKQFLNLSGVAILQRTISKFIEAQPDINVITVLPPDGEYIRWWKDYCLKMNFSCKQILIPGGITRFHSVKVALSKVPDGALVAIQDGVRPFLSVKMIREMFSAFESDEDCKALIPVIPCVDTMKHLLKSDDGSGRLTVACGPDPDRSVLYAVQTPQIFKSELIKEAYGQAYDTSFTDDSSVASRYEIPLTFCMGERLNFKITSPEDLILAEAVLKTVSQNL